MSSARCKEANLWLAELQSGSLEKAARIRLQEHLDGCTACSERARQVDGVVQLLRAEPTAPSERQMDRVWKRLAAGQRDARESERITQTRLPWTRWFLPLAGAAAALLVAFLLWKGQEAPPTTKTPPPQLATSQSPADLGWRVLEEAQVERGTNSRLALRVNTGGSLKIASASEVVSARAGSALRLEGRRHIVLVRGVLKVATFEERTDEVVISAAGATLRPMGTAFEVSMAAGNKLGLVVVEGAVEVRRGEQRLVIEAGQRLDSERVVSLAETHKKSLMDEVTALRQLMRPAATAAAAPAATAPVPAPVTPEKAAAKVETKAKPTPTGHRASGTSLSRDVGADDVRRVERLLAAGQTRASRLLAQTFLRHPSAKKHAPVLSTLVAESLLRERDYASARRAYLRVWRRYSRSTLAPDALYMVGSIELDQLNKPARAMTRFGDYLRRYPAGRQRQGAFLLSVRAAKRSGDKKAATQIAARYLQSYPQGQYAAFMRQQLTKAP